MLRRQPRSGLLDVVCCCVCWMGEISALNPLYSCIRCLMCVHKHCFGIGRLGETVDAEDWICRRCEAEKKALGTQWMLIFEPMKIKCQVRMRCSLKSEETYHTRVAGDECL